MAADLDCALLNLVKAVDRKLTLLDLPMAADLDFVFPSLLTAAGCLVLDLAFPCLLTAVVAHYLVAAVDRVVAVPYFVAVAAVQVFVPFLLMAFCIFAVLIAAFLALPPR